MDCQKIDEDFSSGPQPRAKDMALIRAMGFLSVVCNRPDGEDIDQELYEVIAQEAQEAGIKAIYIPIALTGPTDEDIVKFAEVFKKMPKPIFAYSKTGNRSKALYAA